MPTREQLRGADTFAAGGPWKADLLTLDIGDGPLMVKDFAAKSWLRRLAGRLQIRREWQAYRWLGEFPGIPRLVGRVDGHALALERIEGRPLGYSPDRFNRGPQCFDKLTSIVRRLHASGLVHLDVRAMENVLIRPDGEVFIIDFASAVRLRPGGIAHRLFFRWLATTDRSALLKWKKVLNAGPYTEQERAFLRRFRRFRSWWRVNRKSESESADEC